MTYQKIEYGYVFWNNVLMLPIKRKSLDEKQRFFKKEIPFEEAPAYWEYVCKDGSWDIYYVKRGVNRRLAQANIGEFSPESIICRIKDKDISASDCNKVEKHTVRLGKQTEMAGLYWSKEFDGKSVFDLMEQWPKMPYAHIKMVIENERGSIDSEGIIHRGN